MTNAEMAKILNGLAEVNEVIASMEPRGEFDSERELEAKAERAGAEALLAMDQRKREECAHCDERPGGHEGTIWCAGCLNWWRQQHATQEAENALREVERLRGRVAWMRGRMADVLKDRPHYDYVQFRVEEIDEIIAEIDLFDATDQRTATDEPTPDGGAK